MLLVLDIGNTNITAGLFDKDELIKTFRMITDLELEIDYYRQEFEKNLKEYEIDACTIGSVVNNLGEKLKAFCDEIFGIKTFLFTSNNLTGVKLDVPEPNSVGADRIANAYASYKLYPQPSIVIDSGSATTFDIVSNDGRFFGGIIMPGINMQLSSLCEKTSKLPKIELEEIDSVIGYDTKTCILSGVVRGQVCAIEGLIKECEKEIGEKVSVIATGGLSSLILKYLNRKIDFTNENLTLEGFKFLYELNCKAKNDISI